MPLIAPKLIDCERVWLRMVEKMDLPALLTVNGDAEVTRFLGHGPWKSMTDAEDWFGRISALQAAGTALELVLIAKQTERLIGRCSLFSYEEGNGYAGLGYVLGREYWRQGYMREALSAVIACAFEEMGLRRLEAHLEAPNVASSGLLRRLGFTREGVLRERWLSDGQATNAEVFGLLRAEWRAALAEGAKGAAGAADVAVAAQGAEVRRPAS